MKDARLFTNYKNTLARHNIVMLATVGSKVLGLDTDEKSDIDEIAICLESPEQVIGFAPFEHEIYRTAHDRTGKVDAPSEPGDIDLTVYGLRKFVKMALVGNPNIMQMLYLPKEKCTTYTTIAAELQNLAYNFVSKQVGKAFLGYLKAQRLRLQGLKGQKRINRPELEDAFGYDTKYAMHMLRLGIQGYHFMRDRGLTFPLEERDRNLLRKVRNGEIEFGDLMGHTLDYESSILAFSNEEGIPDKPNYERIEKWLLNLYQREWYENKTTSQHEGTATDTQGENERASSEDRKKAIEEDFPF